MSEWLRSTRQQDARTLPAEIGAAIRAHQDQYNLGDLLATTVACVETESRKTGKGLLGGKSKGVRVTAVLTPRWLLWVIVAERAQPTVMSARLQDIVVQDYATTKFGAMVPDTGIEVSGSFTDVSERGAAFIGLGPAPAAAEFKEAVIRAVQAAKG